MTATPAIAAPADVPAMAKFVTGNLMRHVLVMSLSGTLGLTFTFLVDFLALWWISRLKDETLIAAVGIGGTIQFAVMSVAIGMMIAAVAMVARALGQGDRERARRVATGAMLLTAAVQIVLAGAVYIWRVPILLASGASGSVFVEAERFLILSLPSLPLLAVAIVASSVLRASGDAWRSMAVTMAGGAVALAVDPLLIVWSGWGVAGAGLSLVVARSVMMALGLWYVLGVHRMLARPRLVDMAAIAAPFAAIALPAVATQMSTPFGSWVLTRAIAAHGDSAIAGFGVVMRLTILAFGGIFALSGAIGGIIGQNYGAGRPDRVAEAYLAALKFCAVYTLLTWAVMAAMTGPIAASFGLSPEGAAILRAFTHVTAGSFVFTGALFVANAAFNNLGRPLVSTLSNWVRDGILMYPAALAFGSVWGGPGVIYAQGAANVLVGALACWLGWQHVRGLRRDDPERPNRTPKVTPVRH